MCQCLWLLQPPLRIPWGSLSHWALLVFQRRVCEACVSHWSSSDPRALMWNPFNPCAHSVLGWGMISLYSPELFAMVAPNIKQHRCPSDFQGNQPFMSLYTYSALNVQQVLSLVQFFLCVIIVFPCENLLYMPRIKAMAAFNALFHNLYG